MPLPNVDLGNSPTGTAPNSTQKTQLRAAMGLAIGTDVQAYDSRLSFGVNIYGPIIVAFRNVTVLTTGAPTDIASIALPAWLTKFFTILTGSRCVANAASGTLAGAQFVVNDAPNSSSATDNLTSAWSGNASTSAMVSITGTATSRGPSSSGTIYLRQTANSANAGTVSVYLILVPCL